VVVLRDDVSGCPNDRQAQEDDAEDSERKYFVGAMGGRIAGQVDGAEDQGSNCEGVGEGANDAVVTEQSGDIFFPFLRPAAFSHFRHGYEAR